MEVKRICIYPKDVQRITDKSERYGRSLLAQIRNHYQKQEHQFVSIDEFCQYTGIKPPLVRTFFLSLLRKSLHNFN